MIYLQYLKNVNLVGRKDVLNIKEKKGGVQRRRENSAEDIYIEKNQKGVRERRNLEVEKREKHEVEKHEVEKHEVENLVPN